MKTLALLTATASIWTGLYASGRLGDSPLDPPGEAPVANAAASPLKGKVIAIDPGHNGGNARAPGRINRKVWAGNHYKACDTTGTQTKKGYTEARYTFQVSKRLAKMLRAAGATVVLTRKSNKGVGPCITKRAAKGNNAGADAAVSIHADGGPAGGRGFHVIEPKRIKGLTDDILPASHHLAIDLRKAFEERTNLPRSTYAGNSGLDTRGDLGGLNLSNVPKVFIETANMKNRRDARYISKKKKRKKIARGIFLGLEDFLARG